MKPVVTASKSPSPRVNASNATVRRPELLAPAGDWECAKAAVENGADAIYFGLDRFNARMRAHNFTEADLPELMAFLHQRGVKGYLTVNTLVFSNELDAVQRYLRSMIAAGVDAAIVQDVGLCQLIRHLSPDFPIHASTQMTVTSAAGVEFAKDLGCELVVLARECSIKDIEKIQLQIKDRNVALPLEVFVHGALCVAYSGQCLTSEALGGRSANRGECAQACRMPYDLVVDGETVDMSDGVGDRRYLLSPQDLSGLAVLPDLIRSGVSCLKIEGRLKAPEYVASVTRVYRQALDRAMESSMTNRNDGPVNDTVTVGTNQPSSNQSKTAPPKPILKKSRPGNGRTARVGNSNAQANSRTNSGASLPERYELEMAFSRGLYTGWFEGIDNQKLVHARFAKKRGVYLGTVKRIHPGRDPEIAIRLEAPLKPGDGVVFAGDYSGGKKEQGGRVYGIEQKGNLTYVAFGRRDVDLSKVKPGDRLYKTSDPELEKRIRQTFSGDKPQFKRPIAMEVHGAVGEKLVAIARDPQGHIAQVESEMALEQAQKQPLTQEKVQKQLGRLGNTGYELESIEFQLEGDGMLPVSALNQMRRFLVEQLDEQRSRPKVWQLRDGAQWQALTPSPSPKVGRGESDTVGVGIPDPMQNPQSNPGNNDTPEPTQNPQVRIQRSEGRGMRAPTAGQAELLVLVRRMDQLRAALAMGQASGVTTLYCEFEDPPHYKEAVRLVREARTDSYRPEIWVAPPRITKPKENYILEQVRKCNADGYLIRNYDQLAFFKDERCIGDFSLNVANPITANYFKANFNLERLTASYDLNAHQLESLLQQSPADWFEVTIHQHMPMFHMEHCVFCAFLSEGKDFRDCGRPCDKHEVKLRDRVGKEHILHADAGCRNTLFNSTAQTGAEAAELLQASGLRHFRVEFLHDSPEQVTRTIRNYQELLQGRLEGWQLWKNLKLQNQLGVTRGTLE